MINSRIPLYIVALALLCAPLSPADSDNKITGCVGEGPPCRVFHFVLGELEPERARWMVKEARGEGFNAVQVLITSGVQMENAPWVPRSDAWTKAEFVAWVRETRAQGMEVIPELALLTHQGMFFQDRQPDLMYNRTTYDPRKEETYKRVVALLDEVVATIQPKAIHIGHDEVAGYNMNLGENWLGLGDKMLPADLFLKDILRIHGYLKTRGIDVWMWGDMLVTPDEFPGMAARSLHGSRPGYGKPLRDRLPREIVICDWHYFDTQADFPSLMAMQKEGFRVIGATWKKEETIHNFTRYAAQHGAYGMMATTWLHVQNKEWDVVERIIRESGKTFRRFFPHAH